MRNHTVLNTFICSVTLMGVLLLTPISAFSGFRIGEDIERPKPEFTREGDVIAARLIPRAKNTSVIIRFKTDGGKLASVNSIDFFTCERPEVDVKNFKSALFEVNVTAIPEGKEVNISIFSDFFISSTQYYVFNESLEKSWMIPDIQNTSLPDRVQELILTVKDGGPYDSDGLKNGNISVVGGPRDSFWGYALGTLFIRFFGIFLVLIVLMIGMLISGRIITWYLSRKSDTGSSSPEKQTAKIASLKPEDSGNLMDPGIEQKTVSEAMAAAISLALHLHLSASRSAHATTEETKSSAADAWTQSGRARMMNDRLMIFNR